MKLNYLLTGALLATFSFFSCTSDQNVYLNDGTVRFNASIEGAKTRVGSAWSGAEKLGLYMIGSGETFQTIVGNKAFNVATNGNMSAVDGSPLYYPTDGTTVKFVAYHPYATIGDDNIYKVDFANTTVADHDLLYTGPTTEFDQTHEGVIQLNFSHKLSKLTLTIKDESGQDMTEFTAKTTFPTKADFNIATGALTVTNGSEKELMATVSGNMASTLLLPGTSGKIVFTANGKNFTWDMSGITIESAKNYAYTLKLIPTTDPENKVEVVGNASIIDWGTVQGGEIEVDQDDSGTTPDPNPDPTPDGTPVYTSNIDIDATVLTEKAYIEKVSIEETEFKALKIGTSSVGGSCKTIAIGAGKTKVKFYAFSWAGTTNVALSVQVSNNEEQSIVVQPNTGVSGNNPYFITMPEGAVPYELEIPASDEETTITFDTTVCKKRVVIFGINVE